MTRRIHVWHPGDLGRPIDEMLRTAVEGVLGLVDEACATSSAAWDDIAAPVSTLHDLGQPVSNPFSRSEELMIKKKRISWSELSKFPGRITPIT